jgi:hypothetical protein
MAGIRPVPIPEPWTSVVRRCLPVLDSCGPRCTASAGQAADAVEQGPSILMTI